MSVTAELGTSTLRAQSGSSPAIALRRFAVSQNDFTFGPEVTLAANASPHDGIVADLDGDGKKDLVVANHSFQDVTVLLNRILECPGWRARDGLDRRERRFNQRQRGATGEATASAGSGTGAAPGWVRLSRAGDASTAERSTDGATWTTIGHATVLMPPTILVGLAVTSHNSSATAAASFDQVALQQP